MDESVYREIIQSVKAVGDLTARLDERVKAINEQVQQLQLKIDSQATEGGTISGRVSVLENLDKKLEQQAKEIDNKIMGIQKELSAATRWRTTSESRWKMIADFVYKAAYTILVAYLLYKLNFPSPSLP